MTRRSSKDGVVSMYVVVGQDGVVVGQDDMDQQEEQQEEQQDTVDHALEHDT